jgi:nitroimidazol reductase NimA-like FMN-containing flavoprotein (pyridoxamine 5'-phosphate oxidase superfamily)
MTMKPLSGPWSSEAILRHLQGAVVPMRLASIGKDGFPIVQSLWFLHEDGDLWCATQRTAHVVRRLEHDPRCGFEIAADHIPYRGVRGRAVATIEPARGEEMLRRLLERYTGGTTSKLAERLLARVDGEVALRLSELRVSSWDFTARMTED